jgi:preprotein translocase subunit SecG
MFAFLVVLLVIVAVLLVLVILAQSGQGGGIAATFGGAASSADAFMGSRQQMTLLTKLSWWLGGIFLGLGLILSILSTRARVPSSILDETFQQPAQAPITAPPAGQSAVPLEPVPEKGTTPTPPPSTPQKQP